MIVTETAALRLRYAGSRGDLLKYRLEMRSSRRLPGEREATLLCETSLLISQVVLDANQEQLWLETTVLFGLSQVGEETAVLPGLGQARRTRILRNGFPLEEEDEGSPLSLFVLPEADLQPGDAWESFASVQAVWDDSAGIEQQESVQIPLDCVFTGLDSEGLAVVELGWPPTPVPWLDAEGSQHSVEWWGRFRFDGSAGCLVSAEAQSVHRLTRFEGTRERTNSLSLQLLSAARGETL